MVVTRAAEGDHGAGDGQPQLLDIGKKLLMRKDITVEEAQTIINGIPYVLSQRDYEDWTTAGRWRDREQLRQAVGGVPWAYVNRTGGLAAGRPCVCEAADTLIHELFEQALAQGADENVMLNLCNEFLQNTGPENLRLSVNELLDTIIGITS